MLQKADRGELVVVVGGDERTVKSRVGLTGVEERRRGETRVNFGVLAGGCSHHQRRRRRPDR